MTDFDDLLRQQVERHAVVADHRLGHRRDRLVDGREQPVPGRRGSAGGRCANSLGDEVGVLELVAGLAGGGVEPDAEGLEPAGPPARAGPRPATSRARRRAARRPGRRRPSGGARPAAAPPASASRQSGRRHPGELGAAYVLGSPVDVVGERAVRLHGAHRRRGQLADAAQDRARRRDDRVEAHVVVQGDRVDRRCRPRRPPAAPAAPRRTAAGRRSACSRAA